LTSDRFFCDLGSSDSPEDAWWVGPDGITERRPYEPGCAFRTLAPTGIDDDAPESVGDETVLHPHYQLPARCFAYVGDYDDPATWHLPYKLADNSIDASRLPKAIGAVVKNYRGVRVKTVPEAAIPNVLVTLARAAACLGKISREHPAASPTYEELQNALEQLGRLQDAFAAP
jgi:hypothetical protein